MEKIHKAWDDIGFHAVAWADGEHRVEVEAYRRIGWLGKRWLYEDREDEGGVTEEIGKARRFAHGHVKWDGCADVWFDDCVDGVALHFCDKGQAGNVGVLLERLYQLADEVLPGREILG